MKLIRRVVEILVLLDKKWTNLAKVLINLINLGLNVIKWMGPMGATDIPIEEGLL